MPDLRTPKERAAVLEKMIRCRCDFDNWEPERSPYTGHTWVCPIHRAAADRKRFVPQAEEVQGDA